MEYLFNKTASNIGGADPTWNLDPSANSLFNLNTLKTLVNLGLNTPNIVSAADKEKVYGQSDFPTLNEWADIAETLELNDGYDEASLEMGKKRAYMLWLWLNTTYEQSFE